MIDLLGRAVAAEERANQAEAEARTASVWSTDDPREHVNKRDRIIVIAGDRVMFADVETKHGYGVFLEPGEVDARRYVGEDEAWPGWFWARAPRRQP